MEQVNWMPLESNPEAINIFLQKLGMNTEQYCVYDLLSIQQWAQQMVPRPVIGVILLYQKTKAQTKYQKIQKQLLKIENNNQNIFFMKQFAKNACGTIALFHIVLNAINQYPDIINAPSIFFDFKIDSENQTPEERGNYFKSNKSLLKEHKQAVNNGQSATTEKSNSHFISFIQKEGHLYQLDGGKTMPVNHGECNKEQLLKKSCNVIKKFMQRDPQNVNFSIMVLTRNFGYWQ